MINISLPDGSVRKFDKPVSGAEIAASIGPGLAKAALALRVDGKMVDKPVLLRADGRREWLAVPPGGPLGFEANDDYVLWTGRLGHGDTLVLYTDGVTEAFDLANLAFGEQRLLQALAPGRDAQGQCAALLAAVQAFAAGAPQSDDITVLALRYLRDGGHDEEA